MESIFIQNLISLLREWQTLVGAFLPMVVALLVYPIQKHREKKNQQKETLRRIEIYTSQVINDVGDILTEWISFIDRLRDESIVEFNREIGIFLTNIPVSVPVLYDEKLIQEKTYDIILHNFLLNLGKWVRNFNAFLNERRRSFFELQEETKSQISHFRALKDSNPQQIMGNYRKMLTLYANTTEKSLYGFVRNGIEVTAIAKGSANTVRKSSFGFRRLIYRFRTEYRDYKKLKKLSIDDYLTFQVKVAQHFQSNFLKYIKLYLEKTQNQKMQCMKSKTISTDANDNNCKIKEQVMDLYNLTTEEKEIIRNS